MERLRQNVAVFNLDTDSVIAWLGLTSLLLDDKSEAKSVSEGGPSEPPPARGRLRNSTVAPRVPSGHNAFWHSLSADFVRAGLAPDNGLARSAYNLVRSYCYTFALRPTCRSCGAPFDTVPSAGMVPRARIPSIQTKPEGRV